MTESELFSVLKTKFLEIIEKYGLSNDKIHIQSRSLAPDEAIGNTSRKDFPILSGKEVMLQAEFSGEKGQAFTDAPAIFHGTLEEILQLDLMHDQHARGLFIATMNAVLRKLGIVENTIHCRNGEPEQCAEKAVEWVHERYGTPKITLVGYQPALLEHLSKAYPLRVLDLNPDNVGQERYGVKVEHGIIDYQDAVLNWPELILCTGSTLCNGTIIDYIDIRKEVVFFGTTAAGAAQLLGLKRMCLCSQ